MRLWHISCRCSSKGCVQPVLGFVRLPCGHGFPDAPCQMRRILELSPSRHIRRFPQTPVSVSAPVSRRVPVFLLESDGDTLVLPPYIFCRYAGHDLCRKTFHSRDTARKTNSNGPSLTFLSVKGQEQCYGHARQYCRKIGLVVKQCLRQPV